MQLKEVLRCVLHSIVFNRAFGCVDPIEVPCEAFGNNASFLYLKIEDSIFEKNMERKLDEVSAAAEKLLTSPTLTPMISNPLNWIDLMGFPCCHTVCSVTFAVESIKQPQQQSSSWLSSLSALAFKSTSTASDRERIVFERWTLPLYVFRDRTRHLNEASPDAPLTPKQIRDQSIQQQLNVALKSIISIVNLRRDHLPPTSIGPASSSSLSPTVAASSSQPTSTTIAATVTSPLTFHVEISFTSVVHGLSQSSEEQSLWKKMTTISAPNISLH